VKRFCIFPLFFFFASILVVSQDYKGKGRVAGFVYDEDGRPVHGVKVKLFFVESQSGFDLETDKNGKWTGNWLRSGTWDLDFIKSGYLPQKLRVNIKEFAGNPDIEITIRAIEAQAVSDDLKSVVSEGNRLYEEGKWNDALEAYKSVLEKFPNATILNKSIGNVYFRMEQYDQAIEYYQKVLKENPGNYETMVLIGNSFSNKGDDDKAMEWYNKIAIDEIHDPSVLYNIGANFYEKSRYEESLKYYRKAVEIKQDFTDALYQLGLTHTALGNYKEAIEAFEQYIRQDPDSERSKQAVNFLDILRKKLAENNFS
jgi:tetratricopeptide (TPR) repeat protein